MQADEPRSISHVGPVQQVSSAKEMGIWNNRKAKFLQFNIYL